MEGHVSSESEAHASEQEEEIDVAEVDASVDCDDSVESSLVVVASKVSSDKKRDRKETSAQLPPESVPRRSGRTSRKHAWQESGKYCMAVNKQVMMLVITFFRYLL